MKIVKESSSFNNGNIIICMPPTRRKIAIQQRFRISDGLLTDRRVIDDFFLSFPAILFNFSYRKIGTWRADTRDVIRPANEVHLTSLRLAFTNDKLDLFYPAMYNVGIDLGVCLGSSRPTYFSNLGSLYSELIGYFWQTTFNHGITDLVNLYQSDENPLRNVLGNFKDWQNKTIKDRTWIPDEKYMLSVGYSFEDFEDF